MRNGVSSERVLERALESELRDSVHIEAALRFYADGNEDGGKCARSALASLPSQVKVDRMCAEGEQMLRGIRA